MFLHGVYTGGMMVCLGQFGGEQWRVDEEYCGVKEDKKSLRVINDTYYNVVSAKKCI